MKTLFSQIFLFLCCAVLVSGCFSSRSNIEEPSARNLPRVEKEFRGVWVATVSNIDWPSKPGLTTEQQQQEALAILDTVAALHMNAVIFQVRPQTDAIYKSDLEPWSYYLTGKQGLPPDPYYDPLEFWITEAHKRGLELHAWFNPYRAHVSRRVEITDSSIVRQKPELAKEINDGMYWLDPAKKEVQDHSFNVVMDVVKRYDVDGIHFDDYFYPYSDGIFPDDDSWEEYQKKSGTLSREDWRRMNVNTFIERVYKGIKNEKPYVKFGISPFGIWRPTYPQSIEGYDQYNKLYADAKLWLNKGWIDYWTPQLYWHINQIPQSFPVLLGWWLKENSLHRHLWPGMIIRRSHDEKTADEIVNQIMIERGFVPEAPGHIHFSMKAFMRDSNAVDSSLIAGPYRQQAIVPPSPWLDNVPPEMPAATVERVRDTLTVQWRQKNPGDVFRTIVYYQFDEKWLYSIFNKQDSVYSIPFTRTVYEQPRSRRGEIQEPRAKTERLNALAVSAVDRMGNESKKIFLNIPEAIPDSLFH
ncbi:MAG: family 10 glycosylhydrolase [Bacteroidetes bacterium]|nr:family 10 glycosylhydrolase [Bacteroidota bacterium]